MHSVLCLLLSLQCILAIVSYQYTKNFLSRFYDCIIFYCVNKCNSIYLAIFLLS